ncbi:MAG: hypothetical protein KAT14_02780 [Candidatus Marinimicrobia bacterium]|nr:hypothetical protein [Candidatus Neomarinimicrobiota bacterium]
MIKKIIFTLSLVSFILAGEGLPVLTLPLLAQEGYFPSTPVKPKNGITFSYANWYYDTDYSAISVNYNTFSFGFKGLISGNIDIRGDVPTIDPVGSTSYYNSTLYVGKTWDLDDHWSIKGVANLLTERLFYATSWGASLDAEVAWTFNVRYRALLGVENLGAMTPLNNVPTNIPGRYYAGSDVIFNFFILSFKAGVTRDIDPYFRWGIRYFHPVFDISYSFDNLKQVHHVGADIKWKQFRIEYGQYFHQNGLGYPMMLSVGIHF